MKDFISIGEILIDCVPYAASQKADRLYQMNPGGAPANVACVMAKLGHSSGFIGRVGDDAFGNNCILALALCGVDTGYIQKSASEPTTLALVALGDDGNRSFSFYRHGTADVGLRRDALEGDAFPEAKVFHFGSVSLTDEPSRETTLFAVERAKKAGSMISFDPNLRPLLWTDLEDARREIRSGLALADIVKLSEEEGEFLFGETDAVKICELAGAQCNASMVVVTQAAQGCTCSIKGAVQHSRAFAVNTVDTTGAGDSFLGGILHCLIASGKRPEQLTAAEATHMLDFGNAVGSLATTKKGAIPAIPSIADIDHCMAFSKRI